MKTIHTFRGASFEETFDTVSREFGPDAVILHVREIEKKVFFGLLATGQRVVEMTVAAESPDVPYSIRWQNALARPGFFRAGLVSDILTGTLTGSCPVADRRTLAAVGPSGVGKTFFLLRLLVSLVSVSPPSSSSSPRLPKVGVIIASAQYEETTLTRYVRSQNVPYRQVCDIPEMYSAAAEFRGFDIVLIDTPGFSPRNTAAIASLRELLDVALTDETHLLLPVTASHTFLKDAVEQFVPLRVSHLSLTKWDEVQSVGSMLEFLETVPLPLGSVSLGTELPFSLEIAAPVHFMEKIW